RKCFLASTNRRWSGFAMRAAAPNPQRQPDGTHLSRAGYRRRSAGAVCNLFGGSSCRRCCPSTASACHRLREDVQSRLNCRTQSVRSNSRLSDAVILKEMAMSGTIDNEVFRQEEVQALVAHSSASVGDASPGQAGERDDVARRVSEAYPHDKRMVSSSGKSAALRRGRALRTVRFLLRKVATAAIAVVAVLVALVTWDQYNAGPWTRDGRVRVQVASVAPEISGKITELRIVDNQFVHKGDVLYVIDPFDFDVA